MQYFTDFSEYTTGVQPSDWTRRWVDTGWTTDVIAKVGATGGQVLELLPTGGNDNRAITWDAVDTDAGRDDVEIYVKAWIYGISTTLELHTISRASGANGSHTAYRAGLNSSADNGVPVINTLKWVNGAGTTLSSDTFARSNGDLIHQRVRINGTTVKYRVWHDADPEPSTWTFEDVDSDVSGVGWVGFRKFAGNATSSYIEVDVFSVGTSGDTAPTEAPASGLEITNVPNMTQGVEATITGSGFGATAGTLEYGTTSQGPWTAHAVDTWADTSIIITPNLPTNGEYYWRVTTAEAEEVVGGPNTVSGIAVFPTGWNRRAPLVIQSSLVSALLSDFPLLLTKDTLPSEMLDADGANPAQNGGGDIRFTTDEAGTIQIPAEVVSFVTNNDPALGSAEIWVKVPSVSAVANTAIYVWYNTAGQDSQPAVTDTYGRNAVWSNFARVYHLHESSGSFVDSAGSGNDGSAVGTIGRSATVGGFAGIDLGATSGHSNYVDAATLGLADATSYTFHAWVDFAASQSNWVGVLADGGASSNNFFGAQRNSSDASWRIYASPGSTYREIGTSFSDHAGAGAVMAHWRHTLDVSGAAFLNGAPAGTDTTTYDLSTPVDASPTLKIGNEREGAAGVAGKMARLKIILSPLSDDWIAAEYNNQNDPAAFVIEGTPESTATGPTITFIPTPLTVGQTGVLITGTGFGA